MRVPIVLVVASTLLTFSFPTLAAGQACFGRPTQSGQTGVTAIYEPGVDEWGGAVDWNAPNLWSVRVLGGTVGELVDPEEVETFVGWTKIGMVIEGEEEYPIVTRRTGEDYFGAEGLVEFVLSNFSLCAAGGIQILAGEAALTERLVYLDAIGSQWVDSVQDYAGVKIPLTVALGREGLALGDVDLIPYASFSYWVDRVTFDRVPDGFTYEGWYGQGGVTAAYGQYSAGLGFRTADDLRDESFMASLGYVF
jgi:hypothetical protein